VNKDEPFKVSGILKELPNNTQFDFEWLMSYDLKTSKGYIDSDWTDVSIRTFALLKPGANVEAANKKIKNVIVEHSGKRARTELFMYPLDRLRLYSNFENGKAVGGRIERVRIFALIAGFYSAHRLHKLHEPFNRQERKTCKRSGHSKSDWRGQKFPDQAIPC
jgi:hypothetical protein